MKSASMFYALGAGIYRFRRIIILLWLFALIALLPCMPKLMAPFKASGFENFDSQSYSAMEEVDRRIGFQKHRILILFTKNQLSLADAVFSEEVHRSLKRFKTISDRHELLIGEVKDNSILAVLAFKSAKALNDYKIAQIEADVKPSPHFKVYFGGSDIFLKSINHQTQEDLFRADTIATPVSLVTLIFVFGTLAAALMPIVVGAMCAIMILGVLHYLALQFSLSIFTINIALLLGLCLSLDYALFIISRFREELRLGHSIQESLANTMASAGKAVFFSGLAVFASLSALLIFPVNILVSVGVGGLAAVSLAVLGALTLLPALLAVLKHRINFGQIIKSHKTKDGVWNKIATAVTKRPYWFFSFGLAILLICAYPIRHLQLGIYDYHLLPPNSEGRVFFDKYSESYTQSSLSPILVTVESKGKILSPKNIERTYELVNKIKGFEHVVSVSGYLSWIPNGNLKAYQGMYANTSQLPKNIQKLLKTSVNEHMAVFYVYSKTSSENPETFKLIDKIRAESRAKLMVNVTGTSATNLDVFKGIQDKTKLSVTLILVMTFMVLLILLKSLFLPIKAILMNILSLSATYGSLVYIFQLGHGESILNFDSQGSLDISMLVIIFCALFGFSMDYEVFLLTRIQEYYLKTKDNRKSIIFGIDHSAKIITSAAMLVIVLCASFLIAKVMMVKAFGLGIAIAIFLDAFVIRIFIVPALMTITKSLNWYCPKGLKRILGGK